MVEFDYEGISLNVMTDTAVIEYQDSNRRLKNRIARQVRVSMEFWSFKICHGQLYEFAFIKSVLQYFQQSCRRSRNSTSRITLSKMLHHNKHYHDPPQILSFRARQKNDENFLHIELIVTGKTINECYLDIIDVGMLEIVIGKGISLMSADQLPGQW